MAGHKIKFDKNGSTPKCHLIFGHANVAKYWIHKLYPDSPNQTNLANGEVVLGGKSPIHGLDGSAATIAGAGIVIHARFISPLIDAQGPENYASLTVKFMQGEHEAVGSPKTIRMPLNKGVASFDVGFLFSAN